jgi:hypothetical protein
LQESHSLLAEKTRKSDVLLARLKQILLGDNPSGAIPGLRAELEQLKELQYQWRRETGESLQAFSANVLQQFNGEYFFLPLLVLLAAACNIAGCRSTINWEIIRFRL